MNQIDTERDLQAAKAARREFINRHGKYFSYGMIGILCALAFGIAAVSNSTGQREAQATELARR